MKSYAFQIELEPDEEGWRASYPPWESQGASTWGATQDAALQHLHEVLEMMLEESLREGKSAPTGDRITVIEGPAVTVTV